MDRRLQRCGNDGLWCQRVERSGELRLSSQHGDQPPPARSRALAGLPSLGLGLGLRNAHFNDILTRWPKVEWFEAISENFMDSGGRPREVVRRIAERYPIVLHGVSLSIGSGDPLRQDYLARLKALADELHAAWVSDHLCWTGVGGHNSHDLLPLPLNEDTLKHVIRRVRQVQDTLERPLILENPSSYLSFADSTLDEPTFLRALCEEADCGLLLDVNNVYVSCFNAGTDPAAYLDQVPWERVVQLHLAGHQDCGTHIVDTHDQPVRAEVWDLFRVAWERSGGASPLLEWDGNLPAFDRVHAELLHAHDYMGDAAAGLPARVPPREPLEQERLSTPVDFMVPGVMDRSQMGSV